MLDEALTATRRAVELEPTSAESIHNLATILDELGRTEEARRRWETFLRLESAGECADYARVKLSHASSAKLRRYFEPTRFRARGISNAIQRLN